MFHSFSEALVAIRMSLAWILVDGHASKRTAISLTPVEHSMSGISEILSGRTQSIIVLVGILLKSTVSQMLKHHILSLSIESGMFGSGSQQMPQVGLDLVAIFRRIIEGVVPDALSLAHIWFTDVELTVSLGRSTIVQRRRGPVRGRGMRSTHGWRGP